MVNFVWLDIFDRERKRNTELFILHIVVQPVAPVSLSPEAVGKYTILPSTSRLVVKEGALNLEKNFCTMNL